jgi:S1-C subfamily serine protease
MPTVDLIAACCIVAIVAYGFWAGTATMLALAAFATGAVVGALAAPQLLREGQDSSFALVAALPAALLLGALAATFVERQTLRRQRRLERLERAATIDGVVGGALGAWTAVVAVWLAGAAIVQVGSLRERIDDSTIVGGLNSVLSPPGPAAEPSFTPIALPIVTGTGGGPRIASGNPDVLDDPDVLRADRSVVQIIVDHCGRGGTGSGWIAADGIVVTNAHVTVAADDITVRLRGIGPRQPATPIWFDPRNDLSLLRVAGLRGAAPLPMVNTPRPGTAGAMLGFPLGRHAIRAARIGRQSAKLEGERAPIPDNGTLVPLAGRLMMPFWGNSQPGNSGGPVVDTRGRVLMTVWGGGDTRDSGLGVPNAFVRSALRRAGPAVGLGRCPGASKR